MKRLLGIDALGCCSLVLSVTSWSLLISRSGVGVEDRKRNDENDVAQLMKRWCWIVNNLDVDAFLSSVSSWNSLLHSRHLSIGLIFLMHNILQCH